MEESSVQNRYQQPMSNPILDYDGPARGINQGNAFEQSHDQIHQHFRKDIPQVVYVNLFEFPNGSLYKGQMLQRSK